MPPRNISMDREIDRGESQSGGFKAKVWLGLSIAFGVLILAVVLGSGYTVSQSERAVVLRMGAFSGVSDPGFHTKIPFADSVYPISLLNKLWRVDKPQEGYSHDQQSAHYVISVNYQIKADQVRQTYVDYGGEAGVVATLLVPNVLKLSKVVIGQFTAQTSVQERGKLNDAITQELQKVTADSPLAVLAANVEDIQFGKEYMDSINARMVAEVAVQTQRQNLEKERVLAQIKVTQAQGIADSTLAQATADAKSIVLRGDADAKAIQAKGDALSKNPSLVTLVSAEKWNGTSANPHAAQQHGAVPQRGSAIAPADARAGPRRRQLKSLPFDFRALPSPE
jgi:regulator of protease activity HflC (stomatin/prohibitin superfamily)